MSQINTQDPSITAKMLIQIMQVHSSTSNEPIKIEQVHRITSSDPMNLVILDNG